MWIKWGIFGALIITTLLSIFGEWCLIKIFDRIEARQERERLQRGQPSKPSAPWQAVKPAEASNSNTDKPKVDSKPADNQMAAK